jgi:hypothetical protein
MSPNRALCAALATLLVATGCADESTTGLSVEETEVPVDLSFTFPRVTPTELAYGETAEAASLPARALQDPVDTDPGDVTSTDVLSRIWGAGTKVGVTSEYAYATGRHTYTGNVGRVDTEVIVLMDGEEIGRRPNYNQDYVAFLGDFGMVKEIWAEAYVFTDQKCGLTVDGSSDHRAWWQFFQGASAPHWGESGMSSQAFPPYQQPACDEVDYSYSGGDKSAGTDGNGSVTCWYWVTYDPYTGVVLDSEFLYCDNVEGG